MVKNVPGVVEDVPGVVEDVRGVVEDVPLEAKDTNPYRFESDERQDLTYDNSH